jgi:hypothetical protein
MKKFWTVRPRIVDDEGNNTIEIPPMPPNAAYRTTVPGDLMVASGGPAGNEHDHCIIGGNFGAPSSQIGVDHYHWFIRKPNNEIEQITIGAPHHTHTSAVDPIGRVLPKFYLLLVTCDDAAYQAFMDAGWLEFAERPYDEETETFGPLDTTEWSAGVREAAENRVSNALGLVLPSIINNDKEFLMWLLDVGAYRYEDESKHD